MTRQMHLLFVVVCAFSFVPVLSQYVPVTPCPQFFRYTRNGYGAVEGQISLPLDGSSTLSLSVNASMRGWFGKERSSMKIKLLTPPQDIIFGRVPTVIYSLAFPVQESIPKITDITLNWNNYCTGPPEPLFPGQTVTNMASSHKFFLGGTRGLNIGNTASYEDPDYYYPESES